MVLCLGICFVCWWCCIVIFGNWGCWCVCCWCWNVCGWLVGELFVGCVLVWYGRWCCLVGFWGFLVVFYLFCWVVVWFFCSSGGIVFLLCCMWNGFFVFFVVEVDICFFWFVCDCVGWVGRDVFWRFGCYWWGWCVIVVICGWWVWCNELFFFLDVLVFGGLDIVMWLGGDIWDCVYF